MNLRKAQELSTGNVGLCASLVNETDRLEIKRELYNCYSDEQEGRTFDGAWLYKPDYDFFASLISGRVLDLGCGPGRDALELKIKGLDVLGVDFAKFALRKTKAKGIETRQLNYETDLNIFPDSYFDGMWTNCSLTTTPRNKIQEVISELKRIVKPTGILFFGFIEGPSYQEGWINPDKKYSLPRYRFRDTREGLRDLINSTGLKVIHTRIIPKAISGKNTYVNIYAIKPINHETEHL